MSRRKPTRAQRKAGVVRAPLRPPAPPPAPPPAVELPSPESAPAQPSPSGLAWTPRGSRKAALLAASLLALPLAMGVDLEPPPARRGR